jgi:hypothetical protein
MNTKTVAQHIFLPLFAATTLLAASPLLAQDLGRPARAITPDGVATPLNICPAPLDLTLHATTPNVFTADFPAGALTNVVGFNYSGPDKHFVYTFQWKPAHRCCQVTRAILTVNMKANQGGQSTNSSDAGNDNIALMHLGSTVLPYSARIYSSWHFQAGQQVTKVWNLQGAALANVNANNRLSFYVEDDTSVLSATLQLIGCCLSN